MTSSIESPQVARNLRLTVASGDVLDVREFTVEERISSLYRIVLIVVTANASVEFDAVVGREASFATDAGVSGPSGGARRWDGYCSELEQIGAEPAGLSTYRLTLVPRLWFATQRRNYRIFQQMTELEIALEILRSSWQIEPVVRVDQARYKKRRLRVQYGESDYAFVCRMLEDAGIAFYFESDPETRLVLTDAAQAAAARAPLRHVGDWSGGKGTNERAATSVRIGQRVRPRRYVVRDHDYRRPPSFDLVAEAGSEVGTIEDALERYHHVPGAFLFASDEGDSTPVADDKGRVRADEAEGKLLAERRLHAKRGGARVLELETNAHELMPGAVVLVLDHPHADLGPGRAWLIVESSFRGAHDGAWKHVCKLHSTDIPFRPPLSTRKPRARGVESATVVGPAGEEIHTDEFGRVRVHFHWDRYGKKDEGSSAWIHVSHPSAGGGFGAISLPRVGQEVLVSFLGGDPDRPVVVGRVYTALQTVPYKLPENKTQSGWRSQSSPGGGGYNEVMMEDAAGKELFNIQAQRDLTKLVKNNEDVVIGNNLDELVKNDHTETIGQNQQASVGINRSAHVGAVDTLTVGKRYFASVSPAGASSGSPTSITMVDEEIVLDTGRGATITMKGSTITLKAEKIELLADKELLAKTTKGDVKLMGGPMVKVNC